MSDTARRALAKVVLALAVVVPIWLVAPEIFTGTFSDLGTFLRVAALCVALGAWVAIVGRLLQRVDQGDRIWGRALIYGPVLVVLGLLLWPYVRPARTVDEAFPVVAAAPASTPLPTSTAPPTTKAPTPPTSSPGDPSEPDAAPTTTTEVTPETTTAPTTTTTEPAEPELLATGSFQGLTGHRGRGTAAIYDLPDGSRLLRFEDVDIGSGPALVVYLVPGSDRRDLTDAVNIAPLTAERGNQNYDVPAALELTGEWTVLVWCETFDLEVANATLAL